MSTSKTLNIRVKGDIVKIVEEPTKVIYEFTLEKPTLETIITRYMDITNGGGRV